ncbi:MAG: nucleoside hydrolase [Anaerolineae bacterium]|nr:nucleoside hydrolase [Anaerolineae bacterium]
MTTPVWLDTDIGTDVDDAVALALALRSPEIELVGVSSVYGDVALRSRMVAKLLRLAGRDDVPVYSGASEPLMRERPVYWAGWEGEGLLEPGEKAPGARPGHAANALIEATKARPGEITLLTVGPMTNAALAFALDPSLAQRLAGFVLMGGVARTGENGLELPLAEHNLVCDPEAASLAFRCGRDMVMVGLDVTTKVWFHRDGLERVRRSGGPLGRAVADQLERYLGQRGADRTMMHDPLALAYIMHPDLLRTVSAKVQVETRSEVAAGATWVRQSVDGRTQVAVDVDSAAFEELVLERLSRG